MQTGFDFYRIKTEWTSEREGGALAKTKTEELVYASSYSEAEKVAYALAENQNRTQFGSISIEILKTKITELVYNNVLTQDTELTAGLVCNFFEEAVDTEVGLYCVKVMYMVVDEKTGKLYIYPPSYSDENSVFYLSIKDTQRTVLPSECFICI